MPLSDTQQAEAGRALDARELEVTRSIAALRQELATPFGDSSAEVRDSGEDAEARTDASQELTQLNRLEHELGEIAAARRRVRDGDYGLCEECGQEIPFLRLLAMPAARFCVQHEEQHERGRRPR